MKKITLILSLIILVSCSQDVDIITGVEETPLVPESLIIDELTGVKLENIVVYDRVDMNVKLPADGTYRIKIRHGLNGELISQEKIQGKEGDNLLKVYVNALETSSYKLELTDSDHQTLGITVFSKL